MCLRGASEVKRGVLERTPSRDVRAYVVWEPVLGRLSAEALESGARAGARRIEDDRVGHYLDLEARLGERYAPVLGLPEDVVAWDVYMLFGPGARWEEKLPTPEHWMHQLGRGPPERRLDADRLGALAEKLLPASKPQL